MCFSPSPAPMMSLNEPLKLRFLTQGKVRVNRVGSIFVRRSVLRLRKWGQAGLPGQRYKQALEIHGLLRDLHRGRGWGLEAEHMLDSRRTHSTLRPVIQHAPGNSASGAAL